MYSVLFSDEAKKLFAKLGKEDQGRIISALERCRIRPAHFLKRLVGSPYYSLRAGDQRIIIELKTEEGMLLVMTIEHRKKSYKHLPK
ncbi:type II toxin-antitoxin system RelE/ParE family toxin [Candidatus Micrarchaeota archaeon]|nr:type II toxin-antitoxin system RelE/ParE family toxin [Candidatus Micrarchaeota archaeon]MBD3418377.1 type II toxin-antitoxin system RelE/ParE family toxin [Candidatus Micrarchaeota archaeon]